MGLLLTPYPTVWEYVRQTRPDLPATWVLSFTSLTCFLVLLPKSTLSLHLILVQRLIFPLLWG